MPRKANYNNFIYDDKTLKLLNDTKLDIIAIKRVEEAIKITEGTPFYNNHQGLYEDLAKFRFIIDMPNSEIAKIYKVTIRGIEAWLDKMEWKRTLSESQQLASRKSRDYTKIRRKFKETMLERFSENNLFGSKIEQYVRYKINNELAIRLPDCEVIVGVNNMSCLDKELDIPIIIIKKNKIFKYAIEVDGKQFHEENNKVTKDHKKDIMAIEKGYSIFRIKTIAYYNKNEDIIKRSKADEQIEETISIIKNEVDNNIINIKNTNIK